MPTLAESTSSSRYFKHNPNRNGRPKGSKNKIGESVRWNMLEAFRANGGVDWMIGWAKENPDLFMPMLTKLLPHELAESGHGQSIRVIVYGKDSIPNQSIDITPTAGQEGAVRLQADEQAAPCLDETQAESQ